MRLWILPSSYSRRALVVVLCIPVLLVSLAVLFTDLSVQAASHEKYRCVYQPQTSGVFLGVGLAPSASSPPGTQGKPGRKSRRSQTLIRKLIACCHPPVPQ